MAGGSGELYELKRKYIDASARPIVKIVSVVQPPFTDPCFPQYPWNCTEPGWEIEIVHDAILSLGYFPEYHVVASFEEANAGVISGAYNMCAASQSMEHYPTDRFGLPAVDFGPIVAEDQVLYIMDESKKDVTPRSLIRSAMSIGFYLGLAATFILYKSVKTWNRYVLPTSKAYMWGKITWNIALSVILSVVSSLITLELSKPVIPSMPFEDTKVDMEKHFSGLAEILYAGSCKAVLFENSSSFEAAVNPVNVSWMATETREKLKMAFRNNPPIYGDGIESTLVSHILNDTECRIGITYGVAGDLLAQRYPKQLFAFISLKDGERIPYAHYFHRKTDLAREFRFYFSDGSLADLFTKVGRRTESRKKARSDNYQVKIKVRQLWKSRKARKKHHDLNILDLVDLFIFLVVGLLCGLIQVIAETLFSSRFNC